MSKPFQEIKLHHLTETWNADALIAYSEGLKIGDPLTGEHIRDLVWARASDVFRRRGPVPFIDLGDEPRLDGMGVDEDGVRILHFRICVRLPVRLEAAPNPADEFSPGAPAIMPRLDDAS